VVHEAATGPASGSRGLGWLRSARAGSSVFTLKRGPRLGNGSPCRLTSLGPLSVRAMRAQENRCDVIGVTAIDTWDFLMVEAGGGAGEYGTRALTAADLQLHSPLPDEVDEFIGRCPRADGI